MLPLSQLLPAVCGKSTSHNQKHCGLFVFFKPNLLKFKTDLRISCRVHTNGCLGSSFREANNRSAQTKKVTRDGATRLWSSQTYVLKAFTVICLVYHTVSLGSSLSLLKNVGFSEDQKGKPVRDQSREKQNQARPGNNFWILPSQHKYLPILLFVFFHIPVCPRAIKLLVCTGGSNVGQQVG